MANTENLVSFADRTTEEQRAIASAGGKASGEARRKRKTCIECLTYSRRKAQERRREKGQKPWDMRCQDGVCFVCGAKSMEGKRMCKSCYDKRVPISIENLKKAVDIGERV